MPELARATEIFQRNYIAEQLARCTPAQQAFFKRLYPNGPSSDQILNAADQIDRTIKKNEANVSR